MHLAFLLHIYQPPIQDEKILTQVVNECYKPLFKLIKSHQNLKITINLPLSLIYHLHNLGYDELLKTIKELYESNRVELSSCGAYHPLMTKLPWEIAQKQIILNEYGLSYYFGKHKGFEGEDALLSKNIIGFFPPEMAVNQDLINKLDELGYLWVAVDEPAIDMDKNSKSGVVYSLDKLNIKVVKRNTQLSNLISFRRDYYIEDLIEKILMLRQDGKDIMIAFDGEVFGHHNKEGIFMFENLLSTLEKLQIGTITVSELVDNADTVKANSINEATWGMSSEDVFAKNIYPLWDEKDNKIQNILWEIYNKFVDFYQNKTQQPVQFAGQNIIFETFPIWDTVGLQKIDNLAIKNKLFEEILFLQSLNSDQFWWASQKEVGGKIIFNKNYIVSSLEMYKKLAMMWQDDALYEFTDGKSKEITALLG